VAVFERRDARWVRTGSIDSPAPAPHDRFGFRVLLENDLALIEAAPATGEEPVIYVFHRSGGQWRVVKTFTPEPGFGSRALAIDRFNLLIRDPQTDFEQPSTVGLYVPCPSEGWCRAQTLSGDTGMRDGFGAGGRGAVVSGDTLAVAAPLEGDGRGAVHLFRRHGRFWVREQKVIDVGAGEGEFFGNGIALDSGVLAVTATGADFVPDACPNGGGRGGAVFLFERQEGVWALSQKLTQLDTECVEGFGRDMALGGNLLYASFDQELTHLYRRRLGDTEYRRIAELGFIAQAGPPVFDDVRRELIWGRVETEPNGTVEIYDLRRVAR
jgi:hypothetical protein